MAQLTPTQNSKKGSQGKGFFSTAHPNDIPQVTTPLRPKYGAILGAMLKNKKVATPRQ